MPEDHKRPARRAENAAEAHADFVAKIVADPNSPPALFVLRGYPGPSARENYTRLYLGLDLAAWLDIPTTAVVHTEPVPREFDWLGGAVLWVRRDVQLIPGWARGAFPQWTGWA
jgi:hypothetical protein